MIINSSVMCLHKRGCTADLWYLLIMRTTDCTEDVNKFSSSASVSVAQDRI